MVTPRFSASGRSVSVASSATRDRSTCSRVNDRWSARLSRSSASVRSIARVLTAWRRLDELAGVAVRIVAGHVEQRLRDRQRGAQFVRGVGGESPLFGDVGFEPREHRVEAVGELAELVVAALQPDPVGERSGRGQAGGVGDAGQRGEHPAGEDPPSQQAEHQQERSSATAAAGRESAQQDRAVRARTARLITASGVLPRQCDCAGRCEEPHRRASSRRRRP